MKKILKIKLCPEIELKLLGTIFGCPIYIDLARERNNEKKMHKFLMVSKVLISLFNAPKEEK